MKMVILVVMMVVMTLARRSRSQQECVSKLTGCVEYINGTVKPSAACCGSIKEAVETELPCLCTVYTTPGLLTSFNVTIPQALNLTTNCGVPITLDRCTNNSSSSPSRPHTPPSAAPPSPPASLILLFFLSFFFFI